MASCRVVELSDENPSDIRWAAILLREYVESLPFSVDFQGSQGHALTLSPSLSLSLCLSYTCSSSEIRVLS